MRDIGEMGVVSALHQTGMGGRGGRINSVVLISGTGEAPLEVETKPMGSLSSEEVSSPPDEEACGEVSAVGDVTLSSTELQGISVNASVEVGLIVEGATPRVKPDMGEVSSVDDPLSSSSNNALKLCISASRSLTVKVLRCSSRQVEALLVGDSPSISEGPALPLSDRETKTSAT